MTTSPRDERLTLGEGAVLGVTRAARLLGFRGADAWLRQRKLVRTIVTPDGRTVERVVWRQVLAALEGEEERRQERQTRRVVAPPMAKL